MKTLEELKNCIGGKDEFEHFGTIIHRKEVDINELEGKTFNEVVTGNEYIIFVNNDDAYLMFHSLDYGEDVEIDDICGDINDLVGTPILKAEETSNKENPKSKEDDSYTWTFYKLATAKGYVDIKWYGTSNGWYSEGVDIYHFPLKNGELTYREMSDLERTMEANFNTFLCIKTINNTRKGKGCEEGYAYQFEYVHTDENEKSFYRIVSPNNCGDEVYITDEELRNNFTKICNMIS